MRKWAPGLCGNGRLVWAEMALLDRLESTANGQGTFHNRTRRFVVAEDDEGNDLGNFIGAVATISVEPPMMSTVSEARDLRTFPSRLTTFPSRLTAFPSSLT